MAEAKVGSRWGSVTCDTEIVIVKAATPTLDLECGGQKMVPVDEATTTGSPAPGLDGGTPIGKRYVDEDDTVEVLATKAGAGTLSLAGKPLVLKDAKPLPSSD